MQHSPMRLFLILFSFLPLIVSGQSFSNTLPELLPEMNDIIEIKQRNFIRGFLPSGWRGLEQYDSGRLVRRVSHFRHKLRMDESFEYTKSTNLLRIKNIYTNKEDYSLTINHYDSLRRLVKSELYFDQDTLNPEIVSDNFKFNSLGQVISFERTHFYQNSRRQTDCYELGYSNNRLTEIISRDSCASISKMDMIQYVNSKSANRTINHMNPEVIVVGGRSELGVERYLYKFDKHGNWIKRYFVKSTGRKILEIKRRIKYKDHRLLASKVGTAGQTD